MHLLERDYWGAHRGRTAPLPRDRSRIRSEGSRRYPVGNGQARIWWNDGHKERIRSWTRWDSSQYLQVYGEGWVLSSSLTRFRVCLRVVLFPHTLLQAGPSSFPSPPMSTTMVSLWDRQTHYVRWHCVIVIARLLPRRYALACIGTPSDAYTRLRDASRPGKWPITSSRLRRLPWRMWHAPHKSRASSWRTSPLHTPGQPLLDLPRPRQGGAAKVHLSIPSISLCWQQYEGWVCRESQRTIPHGQRRQARLPSEWLPNRHGVAPYLSMAPRLDHPKKSCRPRLQPSPCAYADGSAVAASSFRPLMTALSPAFEVVDRVAGLHLNHRKCCWVQYGSESCQSLLDWVSTNCEEFREMKIVKYAEYVGTAIGPEGHLHRWTAPRRSSSKEPEK